MEEAKFYNRLENNAVSCRLCHHQCLIGLGKTGVCGVRKNNKGILYSLSYGHPSCLSGDPVEKKPLFHFFPGSLAFSVGTWGCNLACANCLNYSSSQAKNLEKKLSDDIFISPQRIVEQALAEDAASIAYTYNEPTVFAEYALDTMKLARANGLKNIWVSNGYMSRECLEEVIPYLDAINVDLKSIDEDFYVDNCGAKLAPVLENLKTLKQEQVHVEVTTLIIPTLSSEIDMFERIAEFIASELDRETPWHITGFSPEISWKLKDLSATGDDIIYEAYDIGKEAGLKYVYVGNIPGDQKENTYCPKCGELAIQRLGYNVERQDNNGSCQYCDANLDIIE